MAKPALARALLLLALTGSCARTDPGEGPLTILLEGDILALDPNKEFEVITDSVLFNVYEPLVGLGEELEVRTMLAESWEHPRPEQWRFHLRKGVRFQDGTPLTAAEVRESLLAVQGSAELEAAHILNEIEQVVAVGDHVLDIVTREPRAILPSLQSLYVTRRNSKGAFPPLVGTGPFRLREWKPGERVALERWSGYWGSQPEFRDVVFVPVKDPADRIRRLTEGRADIVYGVPPHLAVPQAPGIRFVRRPGLTVYYLGLNVRRKPGNPLADPRVRTAIHLALDREKIVERTLRGAGAVATQPVAPRVYGYNPGLRPIRPDVGRAKRLLAEAGHSGGLKLRLDVPNTRLDVARLIREDLAEIGVELDVNSLERDAVYELGKAGKSDVHFAGWDCSSGEASEFYEFVLHSPAKRYGLGNYGGYSNPAIDQIAETNAAILDPRERRKMLERAAVIVMEELPVIPLFTQDNVYGARDGIRFSPRADSQIRLLDVTRAPN